MRKLQYVDNRKKFEMKPESIRNELNLFQVFYKRNPHRCWQYAYTI